MVEENLSPAKAYLDRAGALEDRSVGQQQPFDRNALQWDARSLLNLCGHVARLEKQWTVVTPGIKSIV